MDYEQIKVVNKKANTILNMVTKNVTGVLHLHGINITFFIVSNVTFLNILPYYYSGLFVYRVGCEFLPFCISSL